MYLIYSSYDITVVCVHMITILGYYVTHKVGATPLQEGATLIRVTCSDSGEFWGDPHQASMKTRYCGHLYSPLLRKRTWCDHRDQIVYNGGVEDSKYTDTSLTPLTCATIALPMTLTFLKVSHHSC